MNITSTTDKPSIFKSIEVGPIVISIIIGVIISSFIVATNAAILGKLILIVVSLFYIMQAGNGLKGDSYEDIKSKERAIISKRVIYLFIALLVCEAGLYNHSSYTDTFDVKTVVTKCECNKDNLNIDFINVKTNKRIERNKVRYDDLDTLELYDGIIGVRTYIVYTPFVKYDEITEYIREKKE